MTTTALNDPRQRVSTKKKALAIGLIAVTSMAYALMGPASAAHADSTVTTGTQLVTDFTTATAPTTITLGADVTVAGGDGAMEAPNNFAVTIDLAGYDLEVNAPLDYPGILVGSLAEVNIIDTVGGGALTLVGAESASSTAIAGPGLRVAGTVTISVTQANITGGNSGVGAAGYGITVAGGSLTVDGTDMVVTGGAGATVTSGYGMIMVSDSNVLFTGGSSATFSTGTGSVGAHGISNGSSSALRITDGSSVTASGSSGSTSGLVNAGATIVNNGSLAAVAGTDPLLTDVGNEGTLVLIDPVAFVGTVGGAYRVPATLDGNGGTPAEVIVYGGSINHWLSLPSTSTDVWPPARAGYTFTGWFTEPTGGTEIPAIAFDGFIEVTSTIYAQWAADAAAPVDPADPAELAATGVTDSSGVVIASSLLLVGLLTLGGAVVARRRS